MQTLEKVLADMYKAGSISFEMAMSKTSKPDELQRLIGGVTGAAGANPCLCGKGTQRRGDVPVSSCPLVLPTPTLYKYQPCQPTLPCSRRRNAKGKRLTLHLKAF